MTVQQFVKSAANWLAYKKMPNGGLSRMNMLIGKRGKMAKEIIDICVPPLRGYPTAY